MVFFFAVFAPSFTLSHILCSEDNSPKSYTLLIAYAYAFTKKKKLALPTEIDVR